MTTANQTTKEPFRPEESAIAWFCEMLLAADRGDFQRAAEAQRELARLGFVVSRHKPRADQKGSAIVESDRTK
jgi:hypothetical protein